MLHSAELSKPINYYPNYFLSELGKNEFLSVTDKVLKKTNQKKTTAFI